MASFWTDPSTRQIRALVRIKGHAPKSKYFTKQEDAEAWATNVERELRKKKRAAKADELTIAEAVRIYTATRLQAGRPVSPESNTHYMGVHLADDLGPELVTTLTPQRLFQWAAARKKQGAGGYTINMELSHLGTILRTAAAILDVSLPDAIGAARPLLFMHQLISGGRKRTRRPVGDELEKVLEWFATHRPNQRDAVEVAVWSGLRRGEICKITWGQLDEKRRCITLVRKHPRATDAEPVAVPLLGRAWEIVDALERGKPAERLFEIHPQTLSKSFKTCCDALGVPNLHFHDLRREANHRLEQAGLSRDERKAVLGHLDDESHDHYVAFTPEELHAAFGKRKT